MKGAPSKRLSHSQAWMRRGSPHCQTHDCINNITDFKLEPPVNRPFANGCIPIRFYKKLNDVKLHYRSQQIGQCILMSFSPNFYYGSEFKPVQGGVDSEVGVTL